MFALGVMEILILLLILFGLAVSAVIVVAVVSASRRSAAMTGSPGAFPCPKCKAFVPSGKASCPACGATVG
ncbi:MAG TPA: hypothetical protein VGN57_02590 [Pirellulaceae bacterium]|jgi:hypothetical protein|nr:hypothetical protein [Pirellulaceae bacterium]